MSCLPSFNGHDNSSTVALHVACLACFSSSPFSPPHLLTPLSCCCSSTRSCSILDTRPSSSPRILPAHPQSPCQVRPSSRHLRVRVAYRPVIEGVLPSYFPVLYVPDAFLHLLSILIGVACFLMAAAFPLPCFTTKLTLSTLASVQTLIARIIDDSVYL